MKSVKSRIEILSDYFLDYKKEIVSQDWDIFFFYFTSVTIGVIHLISVIIYYNRKKRKR